MRRLLLRMIVLVGTLLAVLGPTISGIGPAGALISTTSACSNPGCITTTTITSTLDSYVSPITVSATTATFAERATTAQVTSFSLTGALGFTVLDARGNDQGFVASVSSPGFTSSLFPLLPLTGSSLKVSGMPVVTMTCFGPFACGSGVGLAPAPGSNLAPPGTAVAAECPLQSMGEGAYAVSVPLSLTATGLAAEKLGSYPASWLGSFTVSIMEGQPIGSFRAFGCPAFGSSGS